jgi:uncharacterized secreted protein with C-terminal beta-propeller domain
MLTTRRSPRSSPRSIARAFASLERRRRAPAFSLDFLESRTLMSTSPLSPIWTIYGHSNPQALDYTITVAYNAATRTLDLSLNGTHIESRSAAVTRTIIIFAGAGDDRITVDTGPRHLPVFALGGAGDDILYTTGGKDALNGGAGNDALASGGGNDILLGAEGNDLLWADAGNDLLYGGEGDDTLEGCAGKDRLFGGAGVDTLVGGSQRDWVDGGAGGDTLFSLFRQDTLTRDLSDAAFNLEWRPPVVAHSLPLVPPPVPGPLLPTLDPVFVTLTPRVTPVPDLPILIDTTYGGRQAWQGDPFHYTGPLRQRLIEEALARYENLYGTTPGFGLSGGIADGIRSVRAFSAAASVAGASTISATNTQVAGVDVADLIETDGSYLYMVRQHQLIIIDVRSPQNAHIVSTTALGDDLDNNLYLLNGRIVIVSTSSWKHNAPVTTTVRVFDVTDPAQPPPLAEKSTFSGAMVSSRVIGNALYLVTSTDLALPPPKLVNLDQEPALELFNGFMANRRYQTREEYAQWLEEHIDAYLPQYATTAADGTITQGSLLANFEDRSAGGLLQNGTSVLVLDLGDTTPGPADTLTVTGTPTTLYANQHHLYIFTSDTRATPAPLPGGGTQYEQVTGILKFTLAPGDVSFAAAGEIEGYILDSYAIDEYDGRLRVVTESRDSAGILTHTLYILTDTGSELAITGALAGIGANETIRSVLFVGDRAFIVTFRQVDPLFAIDLSDPDNPLNVGELVMPGYSTYLYAVDHDHLLGIGIGGNTLNQFQLALYNVADLAHPAQIDQQFLGNFWGRFDPHAFAWFPDVGGEEGTLALPTGNSGLAVLRLDTDTGFTPVGTVAHARAAERALRIGDHLYSLAVGELKIVDIHDPSTLIASLALPQPEILPIYFLPPRIVTITGFPPPTVMN